MTDRFDLSFNNKEVRVWVMLFVPIYIVSVIIIMLSGNPYALVASLLLLPAGIAYFIWRYLYRKTKKKETNNT